MRAKEFINEGIFDRFKKKPSQDDSIRQKLEQMSTEELRAQLRDYEGQLPGARASGSLVGAAVSDYAKAIQRELDKRAFNNFTAKNPNWDKGMKEGILDVFKKKQKKPELDLPKWPNSNNANDWMAAKADYYAQYEPESLPNLFSPASGDYLPLSVHVGSSWKPENQSFYREIKKKYPEAVEKAKEITTGIAGRVSLSRVGDHEDFHGMSISEETRIKLGGFGPSEKSKEFVAKVNDMFPESPLSKNNRIMTFGEGNDMSIVQFELTPKQQNKVEVKWIQATPMRSGAGSKAMKILQDLAQKDGIALTLFPWDKGAVSQSKLMKFYKKQGFNPIGTSKNMIWEPK